MTQIDGTWDMASLFVNAPGERSSRCYYGVNVQDRTGKPCIDFQFVECKWLDKPGGNPVPLTAGFIFGTSNLGHDKWNLKFQLNFN